MHQLRDERITRFLSATVHLDGSFANHTWVTLLFRGRQAQAPEQEIDPVAVARHAILSLTRRTRRDRQLAWLLLAVVVAAVFLFIAGAENQISIGWVAVLVLLLPFAGWLVALLIVYTHYSLVRELGHRRLPPALPDDPGRRSSAAPESRIGWRRSTARTSRSSTATCPSWGRATRWTPGS